uniref:uncharacterized protein LOC125414929 n=1 Tax=Myodes glareolus TaxID=447135 RepID=UPI0020215A1B|nr:uncharacterized protein LOC125414929 [Myodes glareolus]
MGQSLTTPLSLTLDHWSDVSKRASNQTLEVKKKKWQSFCSSEWPTFNVGWPRDGTFNKNVILQVKERVFDKGPHGRPDQVAYIVTWESLTNDPPLWVAPFIFPSLPPTSPPPTSSPPPSPPPPSLLKTPTPTVSSLYPALMKEETPKLHGRPKETHKQPSVLPPDPNSPLVDLLSEDPPPYNPQQEPENNEADLATPSPSSRSSPPTASPVASRLRGKREPSPPDSTSQAFPLRQGNNGQFQYWPFSASDLYNWKQHNPPFSKDPIALTNLIESILLTHQPTWDDCQQLLQTLLTSEEKQRVFVEARKQVPGEDGRPTQLPNEIDAAFPLTRPDWDFTTIAGRTHRRLYRQLLIAGLRGAGRRPTNLAQVKQTVQGADESPAAYLERLKEAYHMYTPYDPEDPGQANGLSMSFICQSAPDIRNKLQRLENLQGYTLQDLLKEVEKIFNKRETQEEREDRIRREKEEREDRLRKEAEEKEEARDRKRNRELTRLLAAAVQSQESRQGDRMGERRGPRVERDQCAYCKERGHWAKDCPKKTRKPRGPKPRASLLALDED